MSEFSGKEGEFWVSRFGVEMESFWAEFGGGCLS